MYSCNLSPTLYFLFTLTVVVHGQPWSHNSAIVHTFYVLNSHYPLPLQLMTRVWWRYRWLSVTRSSPTQWSLSTRPALFLHCHHLSTTGSRWMVRLASVYLCSLSLTLCFFICPLSFSPLCFLYSLLLYGTLNSSIWLSKSPVALLILLMLINDLLDHHALQIPSLALL